MSGWRSAWEQRKKNRKPKTTDVQRIVRLPKRYRLSEAQREEISRQCVLAGSFENGFRLLEDQANGIHTFMSEGKGFFNIGVGGGKTFLCMLIASYYYNQNPYDKIILLIPSSVYAQFWTRQLPLARTHLAITVPWLGLGGGTPMRKRLRLAQSGRPGCYVFEYTKLSTKDSIELLDSISPGLIIMDEAQNLAGDIRKSARNKRFWAYVTRREPKGVAMSGTLTSKSPMDYYQLIRWCLGDSCPLPLVKAQAATWSDMLKSGSEEDWFSDKDLETMLPLLRWAGTTLDISGIREAYKERLSTTPGFYSSRGRALGTSLEICNQPADAPGEQLASMISEVSDKWIHPCGDVIRYGIEFHNAMSELSAGFYYHRYWDESHPMVEQAKAHHEAGQDYGRELRQFFQSTKFPRPGLDTPALVGGFHHNSGAIDGWEHLYELWQEWKALDHDDLPPRLSTPVWVDDYKIRHAVEWARKHPTHSILWVSHIAVREKLLAALADAGIPAFDKGGGAKWLPGDGSAQRVNVASIDSHHVGKNLQEFQHQLVVEWPRPSHIVEQMIGRTHRTGQQADRLVVHTNLTIPWDFEQQLATLKDTKYTAETIGGATPRLLLADWNPQPMGFDFGGHA